MFEPSTSRDTLTSMSALRLVCRTPWGEVHDLVALRGHVLVPELLGHVPPLWWLSEEHHPRIAITEVAVLHDQMGVALGRAPYCVSIERWNESARVEPWLPRVPRSVTAASFGPSSALLRESPRLGSLQLPRHVSPQRYPDISRGDRLIAGRDAVAGLFRWIGRLVTTALVAAAILAFAYYVIATALWLYSLRHGMSSRELQDGIMLMIVAFLFATVMGTLTGFRSGDHAPSGRRGGRVGESLVLNIVDAFRLGIWLQLIALVGFLIF